MTDSSNPEGDALSAALSSWHAASVLATSDDGGGFSPPDIFKEVFPPALLFEGTFFEFNRIQMVRLITAAVVVLVMVLVARRAKVVPGRGQSVIELLLNFVRVNIVEEVIGSAARAKPYVPMITVFFIAILAFNLTGMVPGMNFAGTGTSAMPLLLAIMALVVFVKAGIQAQGTGGFIKSTVAPAGVPKPVLVLLSPIEALSAFIMRPVSLTIRLLANMISGHLILVLAFGATHYLFLEATGAMKGMGVLTLAGGTLFTVFKVFIGALQAYIFCLLTTVYISLSIEKH